MNKSSFIIFFAVVLTIYFSVNTYIFVRGFQALASVKSVRIFFIILFWLVVLAYPAGRILERISISGLSNSLTWIGALWLASMAYFFIALALLDDVRILNHFFHFFPDVINNNYEQSKLIFAGILSGIVAITVYCGFINAKTPQVTNVDIKVNKQVLSGKSLNIVAASDIHLGTIITNSRIERIVDSINSLKPDIVLLAGDVLDERPCTGYSK